MKTILPILLLVAAPLFSQTKKEIEIENLFWGANDPCKNLTEVSEKYNNESAVILYLNENYDFHKYGKNVKYDKSTRKRIKLLDNVAVEDFSEFRFKEKSKTGWTSYYTKVKKGNIYLGIKIIKPDGTEVKVDVKSELIEDDNNEKKIAIPNLEIGDIIDFYFYESKPYKFRTSYLFDPIEKTLSDEYPIMKYKFFLETENDFYINFNSFNGAPKLKSIPTDKRSLRRYAIELEDIDKQEYPRWFYPLAELPCYKFQVAFARTSIDALNINAFLPYNTKEIKSVATHEDVLNFYNRKFKPDANLGDLRKRVKEVNYSSDVEKVSDIYYFMRHYYLTRFIEAWVVNEVSGSSTHFQLYGTKSYVIDSEKEFIVNFIDFLRKEKIGYEIIIAKKRYDGKIDDLLLESNTFKLLKVNTTPPLYLEYFDQNTTVNSFSGLLEGADAYALNAKKGYKLENIKTIKMPTSKAEENIESTNVDLSFDINDLAKLNFKIINSSTGHMKESNQSNRLEYYDYIHEDYKKYSTSSLVQLMPGKKKKASLQNDLDSYKAKVVKKNNESFQSTLKGFYDIKEIENYKYEVLSTGRFNVNDKLEYQETFESSNEFIKKAGKNYFVSVGKLIGNQVEVKKNEKERTSNIYINYAKTIENNISINIPEGYSVSGLEKLTFNIDNSSGSFISSGKIEGNKLIISTKKVYKNNYDSSEKWSDIEEFLNAATKFTNTKVLLKK